MLCIASHRIKRVVGRKDDRQSDWNDDELQAGGTSRIYLVTTSTAMADERTWEHEYCNDDHYKAPTEEDRAKIQVSSPPYMLTAWGVACVLGCCCCGVTSACALSS